MQSGLAGAPSRRDMLGARGYAAIVGLARAGGAKRARNA